MTAWEAISPRNRKALLWVLAALALLVFHAMAPTEAPRAVPPSSAPIAPATGDRTIRATAFACLTPEIFREIAALSDDPEAFKIGFAHRVVRGECTVFRVADPVVITDVGIFSGLIRVRHKGDPVAYWTWIQAVGS